MSAYSTNTNTLYTVMRVTEVDMEFQSYLVDYRAKYNDMSIVFVLCCPAFESQSFFRLDGFDFEKITPYCGTTTGGIKVALFYFSHLRQSRILRLFP